MPHKIKDTIQKSPEYFLLPCIAQIFSICLTHGYINREHEYCPKCPPKSSKYIVYTCVMGYHRLIESFNIGKLGEYQERMFFDVKLEA